MSENVKYDISYPKISEQLAINPKFGILGFRIMHSVTIACHERMSSRIKTLGFIGRYSQTDVHRIWLDLRIVPSSPEEQHWSLHKSSEPVRIRNDACAKKKKAHSLIDVSAFMHFPDWNIRKILRLAVCSEAHESNF